MDSMAGKTNSPAERDLRLDIMRGLSLTIIFLNHSPDVYISWISTRHFGFADATEIFVFGSGYAAGLAYRRLAARGQPVLACLRMLHRTWQIYVAHIFLFMALTAAIAYTVNASGNAKFIEDMAALQIVIDPEVTLVQAMLLKFQAVNLDILPMFIVVHLMFLPMIPLMARHAWAVLAGSLLLYLAARHFSWGLPSYPEGARWFFNPLTWQLPFVIGAFCCTQRQALAGLGQARRWLLPAAAVFLALALVMVQSGRIAWLGAVLPDWLHWQIIAADKSDLHPLRVLHFLAAAYVFSTLVRPEAGWLRRKLVEPLRAMGRLPLQIFCLGVLLSFAVHAISTQWALGQAGYIAINALGVAVMAGVGYLAWYYRHLTGQAAAARAG